MPASFPSSVVTFTTKREGAGQFIQSSFVNIIQDEVNAISSGYLDGIARLSALASTAASLSVTGGSTFAGAITSSASTLATLSVAGGSTFSVRPEGLFDMAVVFSESTQNFASSVSTVSFTGRARLSNSSMHDSTAQPSRLVPQSTGLYYAAGGVGFSSNSSGGRKVSILDSSAGVVAAHRSSQVQFAHLVTSGYKYFDALGGFLILEADISGNTPSTISLSSGVGVTWFSMVKV